MEIEEFIADKKLLVEGGEGSFLAKNPHSIFAEKKASPVSDSPVPSQLYYPGTQNVA